MTPKIDMKVKVLTAKVTQLQTSVENLMRTPSHSSQQIEVAVIERQIKDSGQGKSTINTLLFLHC